MCRMFILDEVIASWTKLFQNSPLTAQTLARHAARMPEQLQLLSTLQNALKRLLEAPNPAVHAALLSLLSQLLPDEPDPTAGAALHFPGCSCCF